MKNDAQEMAEYLEGVMQRLEESVAKAEEGEDIVVPTKMRQMPLIEDMTKEEIEEMISEEGLEDMIENSFDIEDLLDYIIGE